MLKLTKENYHSPEANREYMSRSMYEKFLECEAQAVAMLNSEWTEEPSTELLVGSYVHSWNDRTIRDFMANTPAMFTQKLELRAPFKVADKMIAALQNDPLISYTLDGQKEVILTGDFAGATWKVMLDVYNPEKRRIVDIKTTRNITEHVWDEESHSKVNFVEKYNYLRQFAIYAEIERLVAGRSNGDWLNCYIVAVSKQDFPDKEVINMDDTDEIKRFSQELAQIEANMPRIMSVKLGMEDPIRCEKCDYCRSKKQLSTAIHYSLL